MTPVVVALVQRKGGVGKTTLAVSLAAEFARRRYDVALVDADPQGSACRWAEPGELAFPVYEIALADRAEPAWLADVRSVRAELVVIDTAPHERAAAVALELADLAVVPCTPSGLDLEATIRTLEIVRALRRSRGVALGVVLVPNRVDWRTLEGRQIGEALAELGEEVAGPVGTRVDFVRAFGSGRSVHDFAPESRADHEIGILGNCLEKRIRSLAGPQAPALRERPGF